jgi:mitochondrial ornithine carrier protein
MIEINPSLLLTPIELVKCKVQVPATGPAGGAIRVHTPLRVVRDVFRHQGLRGFWHGQLGTLIRETGGSAAWFGTKETVTLAFRKLNARSSRYPNSSINPLGTSKPVAFGNALVPLPLWQQAVAGASAGMSYNFLFFPADTIKSRIQTTSIHSSSPKTRFWAEGMSIYKQYGIKGLYRGCGITVARSAPSSAFIFIIFDSLKERFSFC